MSFDAGLLSQFRKIRPWNTDSINVTNRSINVKVARGQWACIQVVLTTSGENLSNVDVTVDTAPVGFTRQSICREVAHHCKTYNADEDIAHNPIILGVQEIIL
jgi:hypothetical protein